jgi:predicted Zn finger-like uncharacterized protein
MKFVCDNCGTQYLISDEKIGPKGAKVRCKRCGNIIVIRPSSDDGAGENAGPSEDTSRDGLPLGMGEQDQDRDELGEAFDQLLKGGVDTGEDEHEDDDEGPATEIFSMEELERLRSQKEERDKIDEVFSQAEGTDIRPSRGAAEQEDREEWYVAIKDEQIGPMGLPELENRWESGEIGPGTLAWHPGMDDWVAVQDVPKLRYLLGSMESRQVPESVEAGASTPAPAQEEEWAPSTGSSLASLVETEMEAVKESKPPAPEAGESEEMELPDEPEGGALAPWEKEEPISGEVARPSESFFDSSLDQPVTDSGGAVVRAGRGMARPAYLSEGTGGGLNKKLILIGSIALVVLIVVGVVVVKLLQEPPEEQVGKMAPIDKPAGAEDKAAGKSAASGKEAKDDKAATPEKKGEGEEKQAGKEEKPEPKGGEKKDVIVVGKPDRKPGIRTPPAKDKKAHAKKKKKKRVAKAGTKPVERRPPKETKVEPPPSGGGVPGTLSKAQIAATMKKYIRAMKGCVQQQQQRDPSVTGTMLVSFVINGSGKVSLIKILSTEHKGTYVAGCITYIIKSMKFPKFSGDPITIPRVPLRLGG